MSSLATTPVRLSLVLFVAAQLTAGCSSSNDSGSQAMQVPVKENGVNQDGVVASDNADQVLGDIQVTSTNDTTFDTVGSATELTDAANSTELSEAEAPTEQSVEAPQISTTRVDFDIVVPAYSSNELQVRLRWGDIEESATWVADEYWNLSQDLPSNTEHELVVTFYDKNGDVTLASYESKFKTSFNSAESYQIFADQFDSSIWDTDGDGVSNLDESIVGGDSVQLELRDSYFRNNREFRTGTYESRITDERPYYEYVDIEPDPEKPRYEGAPIIGLSQTLTIDIDESGSGTLEDYQYYKGVHWDYTVTTYSATRTNTGDSVIWTGKGKYDSQGEVQNYHVSSVEIKRENAQTLSAVGTYSYRWNGSDPAFVHFYEYNVTGKPIPNSTFCEPLSGTLTHEVRRYGNWTMNRITKGESDQFWTVVETKSEIYGYPIEDIDYPSDLAETVDTYLTRKIGMTFYCEYPELRE